MATNTTNYNLVRPATTDFYDISVQNGNMDIIDQQMKKMDVQNATAKTTLADADVIGLQDSADSNKIKKITWANIKAVLGNLFAAKVSGATNGNFAALNASGNLTDSGKKSTDFAPSGYGLGGVSTQSVADANNCKNNGYYACTTNTPDERWWYIHVCGNYANSVIVQEAYYFNAGDINNPLPIKAVRECYNNVWTAWEYVNPPFAANTIYRTTEHRSGSPVYKKSNSSGTVYWSTDQINWFLDTPEVGVRSATVES